MTNSNRPGTRTRCAALGASAAALIVLAACGASSPSAGSASPTTPGSTAPTAGSTDAVTPTAPASTAKPVPVESNPPGDIPDNLAFVRYSNKAGHYAFTHPEGWARTVSGTTVRFTDKLNGVTVASRASSSAPTPGTARTTVVPGLKKSTPAFELRSVTAITVPAGKGVRIVFRRNSDPDPVTGKVYRDEVEEYLVQSSGRLVVMDLYGPVGADNVDAYRTMSQSLAIR